MGTDSQTASENLNERLDSCHVRSVLRLGSSEESSPLRLVLNQVEQFRDLGVSTLLWRCQHESLEGQLPAIELAGQGSYLATLACRGHRTSPEVPNDWRLSGRRKPVRCSHSLGGNDFIEAFHNPEQLFG